MEGREKVLGERQDEFLRLVADRNVFQDRRLVRLPLLEKLGYGLLKRCELGMSVDGLLDFRLLYLEFRISRSVEWSEECRLKARENLPVAVEIGDIVVRDAPSQMGVDVLEVFRLRAVNVARQVQVEIVLGITDLGKGDHARELWNFDLIV